MSKKRGIELSPKYGGNPSMTCCFYCGESKGVAMIGKMRKRTPDGKPVRGSDVEAPKYVVVDYEPCEKCAEKIKAGFTIFRCTENLHNTFLPEITEGKIADNAVVIKLESAERLLNEAFNLSTDRKVEILRRRFMLISGEFFDEVFAKALSELKSTRV